MPHNLLKSDIETLYDTTPDVEVYNNIFNDLVIFSKAYIKGKFPLIAGLSALKENTIIKIEEDRMNKLLSDIQGKIDKLDKIKIDYEFIRTEEFARIVFNVFDKARIDYREEKLKYYANILINYSTTEFSSDFYKEWILDKISQYTDEHIVFMQKIYNTFVGNLSKYEEEKQIVNLSLSKGMFKQNEFSSDGLNQQKIRICFADLVRDGFIVPTDNIGINIGITEEGLHLIKVLRECGMVNANI